MRAPVVENVWVMLAYGVFARVEYLQVAFSLVARESVALVVPEARVPVGDPEERTGGVVSGGAVTVRVNEVVLLVPRLEPVERSPSNNFGESKKRTPIKPSANPNTWRYESFSPNNGMARVDTKIGCKLTITAVIPAGISIKTA